jgi:hypothetical protein
MSIIDYFCEFVLENINYLESYLIETMNLELFEELLEMCIFESHYDINPLKTFLLNDKSSEYFMNYITGLIIDKIKDDYNSCYDYYGRYNIELEDYLIQCLDEGIIDNNMKNYIYDYFMDLEIDLDIDSLSLNDNMDINLDNLSIS